MEVRPIPLSSESPLVGFEVDKRAIMNALLDTSEKSRSILDIVGPRGVGKTYLAKEIYTSAEVQSHFEVHVWLPLSEYFSIYDAEEYMREQLLINYTNDANKEYMREQLSINYANVLAKGNWREQLSINQRNLIPNFLSSKRYCVVIDFIRGNPTTEKWSEILREFPDNNNGSRVLVIRKPDYDLLSKLKYQVGPRSNEESLEMLLRAALPKDPWDGCPAGEVDDLKMKFVSKCEGLPWPLRFLGGLLSERPWKEVLGIIEAIEAAGMSFVQFAMRYRDLPSYEHRAAFLYFLTFPEGAEIHAKSFSRMLDVDSITKYLYSRERILEDLAESSMIEVTKRYSDYSIKCCRLHDPLLRLLAIHEAKEKRFVWKNDSRITDLFQETIWYESEMVKRNHKFGGKSMDVEQLADASFFFNFGENFPLETALISDRVLEINDSEVEVDVLRQVKKRGELKYLDLNNLRLLPEILEIKGSDDSDQHITTLVVRDRTMKTLPSNELLKMISLEHLLLRNTKVCEISKLPDSLNTLDVRDTPIETLPEWIGSSKLIYLILRNTKVRKIPKLPESLATLDIGGTPIETLPDASLFPNVTTIVLKNTKVDDIPESFTKLRFLEYLDIRNTFVRSLPVSLWSQLRSVLATDTLQHLDGPPTSLKKNNRRSRNDFIPKYDQLETLEIVRVTKDWAKSIPMFGSMRKLGLSYFQNDFTPDNALDWNIITRILEGLERLSSLKIQGSNVPAKIFNVGTCPSYDLFLENLSVGGSYSLFNLRDIQIPPCLITLRLDSLEFDEDPMPIFGELKELQFLQLRWLRYTPQDNKMNCSNGQWSVVGFPELKQLELSHISGLEELSVQEGALPRITHAVIESCRDLKKLSDSLVRRKKPLQELHLKTMPTGFTNSFSIFPFVKITKNQI